MHRNSVTQQTPRLSSFFDDEKDKDTSPNFWVKDQQIQASKDLTPTVGHFFFKRSKKKPGETKRVYICLFSSYLIISKVSIWVNQIINVYSYRPKNGIGNIRV